MISPLTYRLLPQNPGVYIFLDNDDKVIYVGKANNLRSRVSSYFIKSAKLGPKTTLLVSQIYKIKHIRVESEIEALLLEARLVKKHKPKFNSRLTDSKAYPYIEITKDSVPKVLQARSDLDKGSIYFGPFPSVGDMRLVLKIVRKIFPFQSVRNHPKRYCLYYHLGQCPCPPMFNNDSQLKQYKKDIRRLINFLKGKTKLVVSDLEGERNMFSKNLEFENAIQIQRRIDAIKLVTSTFTKPEFYETNINLIEDQLKDELSDLKQVLNSKGYNLTKLDRIECYDISNISGKQATGSMVVFAHGEKDASSYRRFKIKFPPNIVPNDYEMLREVIRRRIKNKIGPIQTF